MKESNIFRINLRDLIHGVLMASLVPVAGVIEQSIQNQSLTFDWNQIGHLALAGGVGYLIKKFFEQGKNEE